MECFGTRGFRHRVSARRVDVAAVPSVPVLLGVLVLTVLGVVLVQLINNNLVLLGVPSTWQRAAVGILLLVGVGVQAVDASRRRRRPAAALEGAA